MYTYRLLQLAFVTILVAACSTTPVHQPEFESGVTSINTKIEYVGPNNIALHEEQYPDDVVLSFPYVSGALFGHISDLPVYIVKADKERSFSLNLLERIETIDHGAAPLNKNLREQGIKILPEDTRLARLGTLPYRYSNRESIGGGGFIDTDSRNILILAYVNQSCEIKGSYAQNGKKYIYQLVFPGKGFHWIEVLVDKNNTVLTNYNQSKNIRFSIHIKNIELI